MKNKIKHAIVRAVVQRLFPEAHELALAVYYADFDAPLSAAVLKKLAQAALEAVGEFDP